MWQKKGQRQTVYATSRIRTCLLAGSYRTPSPASSHKKCGVVMTLKTGGEAFTCRCQVSGNRPCLVLGVGNVKTQTAVECLESRLGNLGEQNIFCFDKHAMCHRAPDSATFSRRRYTPIPCSMPKDTDVENVSLLGSKSTDTADCHSQHPRKKGNKSRLKDFWAGSCGLEARSQAE